MNNITLIDADYRWNTIIENEFTIHYIGNEKRLINFIVELIKETKVDPSQLAASISQLIANFAVIVDGPDYLLAVTDKIRSFPLFYYYKCGEFCISNSARKLKSKYGLKIVNKVSSLEFRMAGYVTAQDTLLENLFQIQAGEYLVWYKKTKQIEKKRYFLFYSPLEREDSTEQLIDELDEITTSIFERCIDRANGRPIFVPLSGGLDSRLIICKLRQLGYDNLSTFSYGPPKNYEARAAKHVAAQLDVPWTYVPCTRKETITFFQSETRKEYWRFSDGLSCLPFMQDIHPLFKLKRMGKLPHNAVLINGQTGDFISGGHVLNCFLDFHAKSQDRIGSLINKHFSQWLNLKTPDNLEIISNKIHQGLSDLFPSGDLNYKMYECWEWQERQSKYVVNGQRSYDFMALDWELPLWQDEYLLFWQKIPLPLKYNQLLYVLYLKKYNYKQLFNEFQPNIWRWPGFSISIVPIAFMIGKIYGKKAKEKFYKYMSCFGHYSNHFSPYNLNYFVKNIQNARGPISFYIDTWQKENELDRAEDISVTEMLG